MNTETDIVRLLGAAQLLVLLSSLLSERLLASVVGSGGMSEILMNIARHPARMRLSNLLALVDSAGVIVLGALFYAVLQRAQSSRMGR